VCDDTDMKKLDKIEMVYDRVTANARLYNGTTIECVVFKYNEVRLEETRMKVAGEDCDPSERYLEIMIEGCVHHHVKSSYIDWLNAHPKNPRTRCANPVGWKSRRGVLLRQDALRPEVW